MRFNTYLGSAVAFSLLAAQQNTVEALNVSALDQQNDYDCALPQIFSLEEAQMDFAQTQATETDAEKAAALEKELAAKKLADLKQQVTALTASLASATNTAAQNTEIKGQLKTLKAAVAAAKAESKTAEDAQIKILETLRDKVAHKDDAYGDKSKTVGEHRDHMKKTIDTLKKKAETPATAVGLNHADWAGLVMSAIGGTFQGIGIADTFLAGREQKQAVESMVRDSVMQQEESVARTSTGSVTSEDFQPDGHLLWAQTGAAAELGADALSTTSPAGEAYAFPFLMLLTNIMFTGFGATMANSFINYQNAKEKLDEDPNKARWYLSYLLSRGVNKGEAKALQTGMDKQDSIGASPSSHSFDPVLPSSPSTHTLQAQTGSDFATYDSVAF